MSKELMVSREDELLIALSGRVSKGTIIPSELEVVASMGSSEEAFRSFLTTLALFGQTSL